MRIGIAGPMTLNLLRPYLPQSVQLPRGYPFPMTALLAGELLQRGYDVTAYTTSVDITEPCYFQTPRFTLCIAPSRPSGRARTLFREDIAGLAAAMRAHPCDILHAHWTYEFAMAAMVSGLPSLITVHDHALAILLQFKDAYRLVRWAMNAYTVRRAPRLTTVSPYLWKRLPRAVQRKTAVIPNFVTNSLFQQPRSAEGSGENYIVSVSNGFGRLKNLENALLGFRLAQPRLKNVRYYLVGEGCEAGGPAERFCEAHGCRENVVFLGPLPYAEVLNLTVNSLLMLHPSYEESFGMSVLEAMALGVPVIAGDRSGNLPHLIQHGQTGYLCNVAAPARIAEALGSLFDDASLRRRMGREARESARKNYSASVIVGRYLDAYASVLGLAPAVEEACLCG